MNKRYWQKPISNREYDVRCPACDHPYYWNRPMKAKFEHDRSVMVSCRKCLILYWISRGTDDNVIVTRRREE
jgi:hypothetical protein